MKKLISLLIVSIILAFSVDVLAQTVYITKTGSKYHNEGCRYLSKSKIAIDLSSAIKKGYGACSVCKPPTLVGSTSNSKASTSSSGKTKVTPQAKNATSQQCAAITKAGTRCTRKAEPGSIYCWQHKK